MTIRRVVVHGLGDSLTAAIADVWTNDRLEPWHEILVELLRTMGLEATLTSAFARTGASSAEILTEQLPEAAISSGDVVCLWAGGNDVLRSGYGLSQTRDALEALFDAVRDAGGVPLTMELPRISDALPGPAWAMRAWNRQGALVNEITARRSAECGGVHIPWPGSHVTGPDGTHLSQLGHYYYAEHYAIALAERWRLTAPVVARPDGLPVFSARQRWRWYLRHGARWMARRRRDKRRRELDAG